MLDLYGVADPARRRLLMDMAREGQRKGWWVAFDDVLPAGAGTYLGLEAEASDLLAFEAQVVPGLVQTAEYARAVIAARRPDLAAEQVDRLVTVQTRRQLERLVEAGSEPKVTMQVLRLASTHRHVLTSSFGILSFAEPGDGDVACAEGIRGQVLLEQRDAEVRTLRRSFDALSRSAMPPPESAELVEGLASRAG